MTRSPFLFSLLAALFVAAVLSFGQDFVIFDYDRPGGIMSQQVWDKLDGKPFKDVKQFISDHSKKQSVLDSIKYILSRYQEPETWKIKLKLTIFYFLLIFLTFVVFIVRFRSKR